MGNRSKSKWRYQTLIGQKFGRLKIVALEPGKGSSNGRLWKCLCDCGKIALVPTGRLTSGNTSSCGCLGTETLHPNLTGQRFGKLTVVEPMGVRDYHARWKCICDCGKEKIVKTGMLRDKSVRSCGCLRSGGGPLPPGESSCNLIISRYKGNAKKHNLIWILSREQAVKLFTGNCHYCGDPPSRTVKVLHKNGSFTYNGIDRLDSTKGYTSDNVVSCCTTCNYKKSRMSFLEFHDWIMKVAKNLSQKYRDRSSQGY
jgi:hypothetical protein